MPVYSEPVGKEIIYKKLEDDKSKSISIIGCGACANISCALYQRNNQPVMSIFLKPIAMIKEIEYLCNLLNKEYGEINSEVIIGLCNYSKKNKKKILKISNKSDTVIVMSCPAGLKTVKVVIPNKKIISGMQVKGFKSVELKLKKFNLYPIDISDANAVL